MTDTTFDERRSLGDKLAIAGMALAAALYLSWIIQPQDNDPGPSCGDPGMVNFIAHQTSPTSLSYCLPDTILERTFQVLPPQ